ncbi:MAG: hypothetical protein K2F79_06560, partial [Muribaculaceae bacterium]|nr:hypothetical protein [Muribaculaceae bacterium]
PPFFFKQNPAYELMPSLVRSEMCTRYSAPTETRLGAKLVPEYMENVTPQSQYDLLEVVKISGFVDRRKGLGRPTKREGRELSKFTDAAADDGWDFDFDFEDLDDDSLD